MKPRNAAWSGRIHFQILLYIVIFAPSIESTESRVLSNFDGFCKDNLDCNETLGITCQLQRCKCAPGGETVFSRTKNRCVGAAGRECLRNGNSTLCVENSLCRDYNYMFLCVCGEGFYQSRDGNCYKIAKFGESCREEDYACGDPVTTSISCVERKCSCLLGENQYYDPLEGRCISYAGSQCLYHYQKPCSDNSYCGEIAENINGASFVVGHRCLCKVGYSYTRSRKCMGRYSTPCSSENPCNHDDHLGCLNGICQCRDPLSQVLDERTGMCKLIVGSTCNPNSGPKCVQNAECVKEKIPINSRKSRRSTNVTEISKCACSNQYSPTPFGTCMMDYGMKCEPGNCNNFNALTCLDGTCACVDSSLKYDNTSKVCYATIGNPCGQIQIYDKSNTKNNDPVEVIVYCEGNGVCSKNQAYAGVSSNGAQMKRTCKSSGPVGTLAKN